MSGLVAVTGATGGLGGRIARRLADRGVAQRLVVRDAARAPRLPGAEVAVSPGYRDRAAMIQALRGTETLLLVSGRESGDRVAEHRSAIEAAVDAGVRRVVYTSFLAAAPDTTFTFGRDHFHTEELIRASGLGFTFLRDSWYLDFLPLMTSPDGVIAGPAGDGRVAWVARDDVADVAVEALVDERHEGATYDLTGPEAHTYAWAAEQLSAALGRTITFRDETVEEAYAAREGQGEPFEVEGWVTSYTAVAAGDLDVVSDAVPRITGHAARTLPEFLAANPGSWAHLRS